MNKYKEFRIEKNHLLPPIIAIKFPPILPMTLPIPPNGSLLGSSTVSTVIVVVDWVLLLLMFEEFKFFDTVVVDELVDGPDPGGQSLSPIRLHPFGIDCPDLCEMQPTFDCFYPVDTVWNSFPTLFVAKPVE